jgi:signal peptidase II
MFPEVLVSAGFVVMVDQASKMLVLRRHRARPHLAATTGSRPQLRLAFNKTMGLGLFRGRFAMLFLWVFAVLGTILLIYHTPPFQTWAPRVGLGAALGGATSNLMDWLLRGAVIDFIDLRVWPVFNLADAFIVLGVGVALWSIQ